MIFKVFLNCLADLKKCKETSELFEDVEEDKAFCNIVEIFNCNINFWSKTILPIINSVGPSSPLIDPSQMKPCFNNVSSILRIIN